ncbi:porin family protein [Spirosoma knui]
MKITLLICHLLLIAVIAPAQRVQPSRSANEASTDNKTSSIGSDLSVGLRLGGNIYLDKGDDVNQQGISAKAQYAPGVTAGLVINYAFDKSFSIQPEVSYTQLGSQYKGNFRGQELKIGSTINVVEVPVLLKYSFGDFSHGIQLFVNAGPFIYYGLSAQTKTTVGTQSDTQKTTFDKNTDGRLIYGVAAGVGASAPIGPGSLLVEARFNYGLGSNAKNASDDDKTKVVTLSVGYLIKLSTLGL